MIQQKTISNVPVKSPTPVGVAKPKALPQTQSLPNAATASNVASPKPTGFSSYVLPAPSSMNEFIGIIGVPGAGKTTWACLFPNPIILDFDKKSPPGVPTIPFWDESFCRSYYKQSPSAPVNRRDCLKAFILKEAINLSKHTIILDSWTSVQAAFDSYSEYERPRDDGKDNVFAFFRNKIKYADEILTLLRSINTTTIITIHEKPERNKDGDLTGKIKPNMEGSFSDTLPSMLTDYVRIVVDPTDVDINTGKPKLKDGKPIELHGRYLQMIPDKVFDPVIGHNKTKNIIAKNLAYVSADTYADWVSLSQPQN